MSSEEAMHTMHTNAHVQNVQQCRRCTHAHTPIEVCASVHEHHAPRTAAGRDNPSEQSTAFAAWLLSCCEQLDIGAATYDPITKKVSRVEQARLAVRSAEDFERVMPWARAKNAAGYNIWIRPAAVLVANPYLMLDDLPLSRARAILQKYSGATVETSPGNHQVWLRCSRPMSREQRQNVLRHLASITGSDSGAISEPRWGRLPGFRQRKPGKSGWTNLLSISAQPLFDPAPYFEPPVVASLPAPRARVVPTHSCNGSSHDDLSRVEFGLACRMLREGVARDVVEGCIRDMVAASGRRKSRDYAKRTVDAAMHAVLKTAKRTLA